LKERRVKAMDFVKAFVCGGLICVLTQILMEKTKLMPGRIMVILVTTGVVLGAVGIYEPFVKFAS
jgi:stage V sporulation protein AE